MNVELKKLLKEVSVFKKYLPIIAVTGIICALASARVSYMIKFLIDGLADNSQGTIIELVPIVVGLAAISAICRYFHIYLMNYVAESVVQNIRQKLLEKFVRLNLSFHNNFKTGSGGLLSRILNDARIIQDGLRIVADVFLHPLQFIALFSYLLYIDWLLTLICLIAAPIIGLILKSISKSMRKYIPQERDAMEHITSTIKEGLDGVRTIQSFNLEDEVANKLKREGRKYLDIRKIVFKRQEASGPATEFIAASLIAAIFVYQSIQIANGHSTVGDLIAFITCLLGLSPSIKKIQESYIRLQEVAISAGRIFAIIDDPSEVPQIENPQPFPTSWDKIRYKGVSFSYDQQPILKNVDLEIKRGEVVALVGMSGSGKSTIVNLLERFFDPSEGTIKVGETSIHDMSLKDLRKNVALVSQDVFLFSDTVENNIWAGDYSKDKSTIPQMAKLANANAFIEKMPAGYENRVGDRGGLLSGGEKQRVSIARAMFKDAPIIILDEATSALDTASEIEVQKGLDHLMEGRTAIIIAHRLSTIQKADKIVVLKQGEIVEVGTHQELLAKQGEYHRFHSLQHS